jgi:hypothetical protein
LRCRPRWRSTAAGDFGRVETILQDAAGGLGEGVDAGAGGVEEAAEELVGDRVDAVAAGGLLAHQRVAHDQVCLSTQRIEEVRNVGRFVLAAEEDLNLGDLAAAGGGLDGLDKELDAGAVVLDGEGLAQDPDVAVADQGEALGLGKVEGEADGLTGSPACFGRALEWYWSRRTNVSMG